MSTADKPLHPVLQVIEARGVVTRIAAGRLQSHPGGENIPDLQQAQSIEADQRYLLSELVYGRVADSEDRDSVDAINAVVACCIRAQDVRVQVTAAYQHDVAVVQDIAVSQPAQLHGRIMTGNSDIAAPSQDANRRSGTIPWEPETGANMFSRRQTQSDPVRFFSQLRDSKFDSVRRLQTLRNSLTRKRSLVQIQYGPPFSKTCPVVGAKRRARNRGSWPLQPPKVLQPG